MKAVFDTNILIDYLKGIESARTELNQYDGKLISVITWMELLVGATESSDESLIRSFCQRFEMISITPEISEEAVRLRRKYKMKLPDAIVYATAKIYDCMLVTRNSRDFALNVPDVRIPYHI
jgi:predicted nucleic acid-binding protein